jgi:8-oxo-dGTP pyrophosphatase MutT (NUDIX family)
MLSQEEYYKSLPKKRVASAVLFWDKNDRLLLLHKTYDDNRWNLPGGVTEINESPKQGAIREVEEETGLIKKDLSFAGLDYKPARSEILSESLQFIFNGGVLNEQEIAQIRLSEEHSEFRFCHLDEALELTSHFVGLRIKAIIESQGRPVYLEKGLGV